TSSFHWCVISRYIFFSYSMWFLSSVSNPEVQSGAVITTCVCQWQQRRKRKVDSKNREFKTDWTDKYAFVLPVGSTKPMSLICNETVALVKSGNVKRHYETKHAHFEQKYPQHSEVRGRQINHLQSYQATCSVIVRSATQQERAYLNIYQNQNHVYWPSTFSYTRNFFWV